MERRNTRSAEASDGKEGKEKTCQKYYNVMESRNKTPAPQKINGEEDQEIFKN